MSMLGDYIHFHKRNYNYWGTNQVRTSKGEDWNTIAAQAKEEITSANKVQSYIAEAKRLQEVYNNLFYAKDFELKGTRFRGELERAIQEALDRQYKLAAGRFNPESLSVDETELQRQFVNAVEKTKERYGTLERKKEMTAKQLMETVDKLILLLNQTEFKSILEAENEINRVKAEIRKIRSRIVAETAGESTTLAAVEDVQTIDSIIQEFNRVPSLYDQNQLLFEWILPFVGLRLDYVAKDELIKEMNNIMNEFNSYSENIRMELDLTELGQRKARIVDINASFDNISITSSSTTNESTISISYTDKNNTILYKEPLEQKKFKGKDIELLSQESLYDILSANNSYNFANHYLNVVTRALNQEPNKAQVLQANRLLKGLVLANQVGDRIFDDKYLVINDTKKKKIYVYSLRVLLYILQVHVTKDNSRYSNIVSLNNNTVITQRWRKKGKELRIKTLLENVRKHKIDVTLKGSDFNGYLSLLRGYMT